MKGILHDPVILITLVIVGFVAVWVMAEMQENKIEN
jgi:hypothetical protein